MLAIGSKVIAFDYTLYVDDKKTPLSCTMKDGEVINIRIHNGEVLADIQFDHWPQGKVSKGHFLYTVHRKLD